jgi:hypothetical protein
MCDKKIQKEEFFFYEPGGPEFSLYIRGDKNCIGCPHRTISYDYISDSDPSAKTEYGCRDLEGTFGKSIELRMKK